ncbi:MAG: aminotransferase class V-fold PLP-dependent enzyme, partial [Clostridia bacterium]|nr:aminotransferase class V-fold PLP-dependent enzyme [Clostridia bacterium]
LSKRLSERLLTMPKVNLYTPNLMGSVLLFSIEDISSDHVGAFLNERGFCVRTGFHCAALAHATLGTPPSGAVRVSPSLFNTATQMDALADALRDLL